MFHQRKYYSIVVFMVLSFLSSHVAAQSIEMLPSKDGFDSVNLRQILGQESLSHTPNREPSDVPVFLPVLNNMGWDDVCQSWVSVQYIGCEPAKTVLYFWGEPGFCPPQAAGPMGLECSGLQAPGRPWVYLLAQGPPGARSGAVFRFSALKLSELPGNPGPTLADDLGFDDIMSDIMCEILFFGLVGDSNDFARFLNAYNGGLEFAAIPMSVAKGSGSIAVSVVRECENSNGGGTLRSAYQGLMLPDVMASKRTEAAQTYFLPTVHADRVGLSSLLYLQNVSASDCASIEIWFSSQDACSSIALCDISSLATGETWFVDPSECLGSDWLGSAWVRSTAPLAIVVETQGGSQMTSYVAELPPSLSHSADTGFDEQEDPTSRSPQVLIGALAYAGFEGWNSEIQLMNLESSIDANVRISFLDSSGATLATINDWICPLGRRAYRPSLIADLPSGWKGSVRVDSLDSRGSTPGSVLRAASVAGLVASYSDGQGAEGDAQQAFQYPFSAIGESEQSLSENPEAWSSASTGLIAIPRLLRRSQSDETSSILSVANASAYPGFTVFALYLYDQNAYVDHICFSLQSGQSRRFDLGAWAFLSSDFYGAGVVSASYWDQSVGLVGESSTIGAPNLHAVVIEQPATSAQGPSQRDLSSAIRGRPFQLQTSSFVDAEGWCDLASLPACP